MTRSTCWNKAEKLQKKTYHTDSTHIWIPALREVDFQGSAKRRANRTKPKANLYWSSRSLHCKHPPNQIQNQSTKFDSIISSRTWKKSEKFSSAMVLSIWKHSFPRIQGQLMPMTRVISGFVTPKDKTKSNPLPRIKVRMFWKIVVGF